MFDIFILIAPLYLVLATGYLSARTGYLGVELFRGIGKIVMGLCMPAMIFLAVLRASDGAPLDPAFILAYLAASLLLFFAGLAVLRIMFGQPPTAAAVLALGMSVANSGFFGFPVASLVFGVEAAGLVFAQTLVVENLVMIPLAMTLAEVAEGERRSAFGAMVKALRSAARNPLLIALALGLLASLAGVRPPEASLRALEMLAAVAPGAALLVTGAAVAGYSLRGDLPPAFATAFGKLVLHPLLVMMAFIAMPGIDPIRAKLTLALRFSA